MTQSIKPWLVGKMQIAPPFQQVRYDPLSCCKSPGKMLMFTRLTEETQFWISTNESFMGWPSFATTIAYLVDSPYSHVKPLFLIRRHRVHEGDWSILEDVKGELKPANWPSNPPDCLSKIWQHLLQWKSKAFQIARIPFQCEDRL